MARGHITYYVSPVHQELFNDIKKFEPFPPKRIRFWKRWGPPVVALWVFMKWGAWAQHQEEVRHRP